MDPSDRFVNRRGAITLESHSAAAMALERLAAERTEADSPARDAAEVSPWLYVAGLCVTLSGLYAVNFGREEPYFAAASYMIATLGYAMSYALRRYRVDYEALKLPLLVLVGLGLFAWITTGHVISGVDVQGQPDRSHAMQMLCIWVALLQPYAASSDMAVLSSCVPCMSLIALVSTTSPDSEVQYAFLVFIAAATFLMVHENYLRTRAIATVSGLVRNERKLFAGQLALALTCVAAAFVLANVVAIPMHWFGRSLSLAQNWGPTSTITAKATAILSGGLGNDDKTLALSTGPMIESDAAVMSVEAPGPFKWRGATFDYYTGSSFENRLSTPHKLAAADETADLQQLRQFHPVDNLPAAGDTAAYKVPRSQYEPPAPGERTIRQRVHMLAGGIPQYFTAGSPISVVTPRDSEVVCTEAGTIASDAPLNANTEYRVTSDAPIDDAIKIRTASQNSAEVPTAIADRYLQVGYGATSENPRLRRIAESATAGVTNPFDKATAIAGYIARTCKYNLDTPAAPHDSDRVEHFLSVSQQGYCDSYAAAMTMLARYAGIPARVVTGYVAGTPDGQGKFLVTEKDRHAWSELYFAGVGWVPFDATDGTVDITERSARGRQKPSDLLAWFTSHGILPPLMAVALVGLILFVVVTELLPRLRERKAEQGAESLPAANLAVIQAYLDACSTLEKRGLRRSRSATPAEYLAEADSGLAALAPAARDALASLTALHDRYRYGKAVATQPEADQAKSLAAAVRAAIGRVPRKALA